MDNMDQLKKVLQLKWCQMPQDLIKKHVDLPKRMTVVVDTSKYAEMIYYFVASSQLQQQSVFHTVFENCILSTGLIYWNHHVYACLSVKRINAFRCYELGQTTKIWSRRIKCMLSYG